MNQAQRSARSAQHPDFASAPAPHPRLRDAYDHAAGSRRPLHAGARCSAPAGGRLSGRVSPPTSRFTGSAAQCQPSAGAGSALGWAIEACF